MPRSSAFLPSISAADSNRSDRSVINGALRRSRRDPREHCGAAAMIQGEVAAPRRHQGHTAAAHGDPRECCGVVAADPDEPNRFQRHDAIHREPWIVPTLHSHVLGVSTTPTSAHAACVLIPAQFRQLAAAQDGLVTRRQALECGISIDALRHAVGKGKRWQRVVTGVYATFTGPLQERQEATERRRARYAALGWTVLPVSPGGPGSSSVIGEASRMAISCGYRTTPPWITHSAAKPT